MNNRFRLFSSLIVGLSVLFHTATATLSSSSKKAFLPTGTDLKSTTKSTARTRSRSFSSSLSLFGIRGGGLFGGGKDDDSGSAGAGAGAVASANSSGDRPQYPAMSQDEIEDWLEHIPVYAVTDSNGAGVVLKPDDDTSVFYFFLSPLAANATLSQLKNTNEEMDLKVSAFSLGKIWFKLLNSDPDQEVMLKSPGADDGEGKPTTGVEYRLVPDTRDLLGARMLLTMNPEDGEMLKKGETMTPEMAQKAIQKAMTEAPKFKATFNEIPIFTIAQMRMQKRNDQGETGEPLTLLPMYFSLQNMVGTWQAFMAQSGASPEMQEVEPAINLLSLHDLIEMMMKGSEIDFKSVVLVPPVPDTMGPGGGSMGSPSAGSGASASADSMPGMGGATLGDV